MKNEYPERIYVDRDEEEGKRWYSIKGMGTEYVRADIVERQLAEAKERNKFLEQALKNAYHPPF